MKVMAITTAAHTRAVSRHSLLTGRPLRPRLSAPRAC